MRRVVLLIVAVAVLLLAACSWRQFVHDGKPGAEVGWTVNGPLGALIGFIATAIGSAVAREIEKGRLRRSGVLTDTRARQEAITARTARPAPPPQSHFPTDV